MKKKIAHNVRGFTQGGIESTEVQLTTNVEENSNAQILHFCPPCVKPLVSGSFSFGVQF